jgi:hypothetical protein
MEMVRLCWLGIPRQIAFRATTEIDVDQHRYVICLSLSFMPPPPLHLRERDQGQDPASLEQQTIHRRA